MYYSKVEKVYINEGQNFTIGKITYPYKALLQMSDELVDKFGIIEVITKGEFKNPKFYFNTEELIDGVRIITSTPKALDSLKESLIYEINAIAASILIKTDWYITRSIELNSPAPVSIISDRNRIRELSNKYVDLITNCSKVEDLEKESTLFIW